MFMGVERGDLQGNYRRGALLIPLIYNFKLFIPNLFLLLQINSITFFDAITRCYLLFFTILNWVSSHVFNIDLLILVTFIMKIKIN